MANTIYIEVWRNPEDASKWIANVQGDVGRSIKTGDYPVWWFNQSNWNYWFKFTGKKKTAIVCSNDAFTRIECIQIAAMIVEGKGLRVWEIDLSTLTP